MECQELLAQILYVCPALSGKILVIHAALTSQQRKLVGQLFNSGTLLVVVATAAFEMGVDKKDLTRAVCYRNIKSIESLGQREGRIRVPRSDAKECEIRVIFDSAKMAQSELQKTEVKQVVIRKESKAQIEAISQKRQREVAAKRIGFLLSYKYVTLM